MKSHKHTCANYKCSILDTTQENYIGKIKQESPADAGIPARRKR